MPRSRRDEVRLLNRTGTGYTNRPARALSDGWQLEPEAVDRDTQQRLSDHAGIERAQAREVERARLADATIARRIQRVEAQARLTGIAIRGEMHVVRRTLQAGRSREAVSRRLAVVERKLWPRLDGLSD